MALRLPPLSSLRLFEAAGRRQSFKLAAEELGLTPGAVSHGVLSLERWLGVALFERRTNGVVLTKAGADYLSFVSEALATIAVGARRLPGPRQGRRVTMSLAPTFASRWLVPRLAGFRARRPDIALVMDTSHRQVGFPVDNVDLAVRVAQTPSPGLPSTRLFTETLIPVCSPAFLDRCGGPGGLDLTTAPLLHVVTAIDDWAAWLAAAGLADFDPRGGISFDTIHMAMEAAAAGLGVAIGRRPLIDADLAAGRLAPAAGPPLRSSAGYWLVQAPDAADRPEVKAFADWLIAAASEQD